MLALSLSRMYLAMHSIDQVVLGCVMGLVSLNLYWVCGGKQKIELFLNNSYNKAVRVCSFFFLSCLTLFVYVIARFKISYFS